MPTAALACNRIVLTGRGSSLHAQHPRQLRLVAADHTALLVHTAELVHAQSALLAADTLIVVVSQSGRSAEMAQLLDLLATRPSRPFYRGRDQYRRLPLAARADFVVSLHAGPEFSVSCKIYLATLVALAWLTGCTE